MTLNEIMNESKTCRDELDKISDEIDAHEAYCSLAGEKGGSILYCQLRKLHTDLVNISWMMSVTRRDIMTNKR